MFINFSNHPSTKWDKDQVLAAEAFDEIVDLSFPEIDVMSSKEDIDACAVQWAEKISALNPDCVMCQGEFTFVYRVVSLLKEKGIKVVAACSKRIVLDEGNDDEGYRKVSLFKFVQFREY